MSLSENIKLICEVNNAKILYDLLISLYIKKIIK